MVSGFDPRIVRVGIEINGEVEFFEDLDIRIQGQKFAGPTANYADIKISNLNRDQRNYILTKATPISMRNRPQRTPIYVTVDVGRQSYGTFRLFEGTVYTSKVLPPPDIGIVLRSLTQSEFSGLIASNSQGAITSLEIIAKSVAKQNNLILQYKVAKQKQIANYSFTGGVNKQVEKLALMGDVVAFIDNKNLVVMDKYTNRTPQNFILSQETGMIGVPQATEMGITAQMLISPDIQIGGGITVNSKINPSVNGENYNIKQIGFDIANRDNPFFYNLVCSNNFLSEGSF